MVKEETNFEKLQRKAKENKTNWLIEFIKGSTTTIPIFEKKEESDD